MGARFLALAALALAACAKDAPSDDACSQLFGHYLELLAESVASRGSTPAIELSLEESKTELTEAHRADFIRECRGRMTPSQVKCGLAATDWKSAEACVPSSR
jgi:hypothetical protein